ncbi:hypothetical protein IFM89_037616, partial [Coptis chinensis]
MAGNAMGSCLKSSGNFFSASTQFRDPYKLCEEFRPFGGVLQECHQLVQAHGDYNQMGMAGGELVVTPVETTGFVPEEATIVGNTCLYSATGDQVFIRGKAGERFAVRNSLAQAVVEGTGDHCCEYMTGGCVVILGKVGINVAAGMTGGLAYILDDDDTLIPKCKLTIRPTPPVSVDTSLYSHPTVERDIIMRARMVMTSKYGTPLEMASGVGCQ